MSKKTALLAVLTASLLLNVWLLMGKKVVLAPTNSNLDPDGPFIPDIAQGAANPPCLVDADCKRWSAQGYCDTADQAFQDKDIGICGKKGGK